MISRLGTARTWRLTRRLGLRLSLAVLSIAALGVLLGAAIGVSGGRGDSGNPAAVRSVAVRDVPTSFGSVAASGLRADAASPLHGRPMATVRVAVTLTSRIDRPVLYSPGQFRLRARRGGGTITALRTGGLPRTLRPHAEARVLLSYLVPRAASRLELEFDDLERGEPAHIQLGALVVSGRAPTPQAHHQTSG